MGEEQGWVSRSEPFMIFRLIGQSCGPMAPIASFSIVPYMWA